MGQGSHGQYVTLTKLSNYCYSNGLDAHQQQMDFIRNTPSPPPFEEKGLLERAERIKHEQAKAYRESALDRIRFGYECRGEPIPFGLSDKKPLGNLILQIF